MIDHNSGRKYEYKKGVVAGFLAGIAMMIADITMLTAMIKLSQVLGRKFMVLGLSWEAPDIKKS